MISQPDLLTEGRCTKAALVRKSNRRNVGMEQHMLRQRITLKEDLVAYRTLDDQNVGVRLQMQIQVLARAVPLGAERTSKLALKPVSREVLLQRVRVREQFVASSANAVVLLQMVFIVVCVQLVEVSECLLADDAL